MNQKSLTQLALFEIHRHQILLNAKDSTGNYIWPEAYLYAVANRVYPYFHDSWCGDNVDPYESIYTVKKEFISEVLTDLANLWNEEKPIPTFYELEKKYGGRANRVDLINTLRYAYLDQGFDKNFWKAILKRYEHPTEAAGIIRSFEDSELYFL